MGGVGFVGELKVGGDDVFAPGEVAAGDVDGTLGIDGTGWAGADALVGDGGYPLGTIVGVDGLPVVGDW